MADFFRRRWFLLALVVVLTAGLGSPRSLEAAAEAVPRLFVVAAVLFMMSLPLEARAMWRVIRRPLAPGLAVLVSYGLLPPLAWVVAQPLPRGLAEGVVIAAVAPCTLASAAVWTRRAGGNDAVALLVTMLTNITCFAVAPAWFWLLLGAHVEIPFSDMAGKLIVLVVLPILAGQLLRLFQPIGAWALRQKTLLGVFSQLGMLSIVFVGAVKSGLTLAADTGAVAGWDWGLMLAGVAGLHLIGLATGYALGQRCGLPRVDVLAVAVSGSQKTLMVGLWIATEYAAVFGELAVLPMVAFHVLQLFIDTLWTDHCRKTAPEAAASGAAA